MRFFPLKHFQLACTLVLGISSLVVAHGHDDNNDMNMDLGVSTMPTSHISPQQNATMIAEPETYFQYGAHWVLLMSHIVIMTIGWVFILPVGKREDFQLVFDIR